MGSNNKPTARRYHGENEIINSLDWVEPGKVLWFVNGNKGIRAIFVPEDDDTKERALYEYKFRWNGDDDES